jgi:hypothetical protein
VIFLIRKQIYNENLWIRLVCKRTPNWIRIAGFYKGEFVEDLGNWHKAFISLVFCYKKPLNIGYNYSLGCTT